MVGSPGCGSKGMFGEVALQETFCLVAQRS